MALLVPEIHRPIGGSFDCDRRQKREFFFTNTPSSSTYQD
jgi:hypothetical protein